MRWMTLVALMASISGAATARPADDPARAILRQGLEAQGGEAKLRALKSIRYEAAGYRNMLEESERPEGPYIEEFLAVTETDDLAGRRYRTASTSSIYPVDGYSSVTLVDGDAAMFNFAGHERPVSRLTAQIAAERVALSAPRLLLTALDAKDVHLEADAILHHLPQKVVGFSLDGAPVRIYLNAYSHLPTAVDYSGPEAHAGFWAYVGDVTQRTVFSYWWIAKGGVRLPMQWNVETNGLADQMLVVRKLELDAALPEAELTLSAEMRRRSEAIAPVSGPAALHLSTAPSAIREVAPGVSLYQGAWNITLVKQDDGVVIFESPISSAFSAEVIAEVHRRYPGAPIKALITTSDAWPHIAGVRAYVAEGAPIYALDLNRPILQRFIDAPYRTKPDRLAKAPRKPRFHLVSAPTRLGTGSNRLEIIPMRGPTTERQMMIYFPERRLLYASDAFQPGDDGSFHVPQTTSEVVEAARRAHLDVETVFEMHLAPTPWRKVLEAVEAAGRTDTPDGKIG